MTTIIQSRTEFRGALKGYVALGSAQSDQDQYRINTIASALFHALHFANFDAPKRVTESALGSIKSDVARAADAARAVWEANKKVNLDTEQAIAQALELTEPVIAALREVRLEQERNKAEKKRAKEAAEREAAIAARESTVPSPFMLKGSDGTIDLSQAEYDTLMGLLAEIRSGAIVKTVDVRNNRKAKAA